MQRIIILLATCLLLNAFQNLDAKLNVVPCDTEVMVNDSTYMNCSTSLKAERVHWRHGNNYVYAGTTILEPYDVRRFSVEINSSTGTNNLVIRSVQPSDAGRYECLEDEGFGEQSSAQLIVLDDDPVCKSNMHSRGVIGPNDCDIEPDEVNLSCSITYHGNVYPILQWKASGGNQSISEGLYNITLKKNAVTYTLAMNSTLDLINSSFICQTTRTSKRNYSCSFDVIKILYAIGSKVTINMTMNDEVTCFANTSQSCSYKWKWFNGHDWIDLSNGQILKPNEVGRYRCEAKCSIGNKSCTVESMFAKVYSTPATSERNLMALLVLIVLPVIALIGVVIYFWKRRQNQERWLMELNRKVAIREEPLQELYESEKESHAKNLRISNGMIRTAEIVAELYQREVLTEKERDDIQNLLSTPVRANEQLLSIMQSKNSEACDCFLEALINTDQRHIAKIWKCEDEYLDNNHSLVIQRNYKTLIDNLDVGDLLDRLYQADLLSDRDRETITSKPTKHEKCEKLLAIVSKFIPDNYKKFVQALQESNQEHVVSILTGKDEWGREEREKRQQRLIDHGMQDPHRTYHEQAAADSDDKAGDDVADDNDGDDDKQKKLSVKQLILLSK